MRKDYVEPDDYEYEPTPHDEVLEKSKAALHAPADDADNIDGAAKIFIRAEPKLK